MEHSLKTERLILRKLTFYDSIFIVKLLNSPGWIEFIGDRGVRTEEDAKGYLQNGPLLSYEKNGFGLYLVELLETGDPIGMCGILKRDNLEHPDLGFAFLPEFMGKGYAYEAADAVVKYARKQLRIETLLAITLPENATSIKLLGKLGMKYDGVVKSPDSKENLNLYKLELKTD
ncbi:Protein N-acetyltransferase, RimJ/RimL family [Aquiflexum balticum DSM 16537]|uniref:Protein N-acetyltransferase, RimJ/RimL family n=1 Tax=Aquiflexum balticum DSM 16537 TaxID=758820 RepID=A0A1W2HBG5_9BACT|nr:GNAT family N-acetyltransferase [Aquiflexum balticum]SMD46197.1 Protein N-acetyltransferase, RimJ/RimL family [Aquiflexum balticum DSM 16537]